jgi:hypothetical protein
MNKFHADIEYMAVVDGDPRFIGWKGTVKADNVGDATTKANEKVATVARRRVLDAVEDGSFTMSDREVNLLTLDECLNTLEKYDTRLHWEEQVNDVRQC